MEGIETLVISLKCNVVLGFYNSLVGPTCVAMPEDNKNICIEFTEQILPPVEPNSMIIYDS